MKEFTFTGFPGVIRLENEMKSKSITIKRCIGVFSDGKLVSIHMGGHTPVDIPEENKSNDGFVSIDVYDMMCNAYKEAFDECTRLKAKLKNIQEIVKES